MSSEERDEFEVLVACEWSGVVRDALISRGVHAYSCDLLPSEIPGPHIRGDVRDMLDKGWDAMIAFPPCTHLAGCGAPSFKFKAHLQPKALEFVRTLLEAPIPLIALENPVGIISTRIRKPDQIIQPWQFGEDASKRTCLWLKNLPLLKPTKIIEPRYYIDNKPRWGNQTPGGHNKLGPSKDRGKLRGKTFGGIAEAMAEQWCGHEERVR